MTEEQRAELIRLAGIAHDKREAYRWLGMGNVPTDPEKARENSIRYTLADAERQEAEANLRAAIAQVAQDSYDGEVRRLAEALMRVPA